jgi:gamma-glutamylputrescine oxidase
MSLLARTPKLFWCGNDFLTTRAVARGGRPLSRVYSSPAIQMSGFSDLPLRSDTPSPSVWDDAPWSGLPMLTGDLRAEVCVIGLGGSGLTCIDELLVAGHDVIGLDGGIVSQGAAGRNGGLLLAGLAEFFHVAAARHGRSVIGALYRLTMNEIDRLIEDFPGAARKTGSLRIAHDAIERADCEAQYSAMTREGLPVERYDGSEGEGLLFPQDGVFQPLRRCRGMAERAGRFGARLFERSVVTGIEGSDSTRSGMAIVRTAHGSVRAGRVIVAVDGRLRSLIPELSGELRDVRLQMLATAPTDEVSIPRPVYTRWGFDYWQQLPDGRVALGGCRDQSMHTEDTDDATPTGPIHDALLRCLRARLKVSAPVTHRWAAIVSFRDGKLPIIREVRPDVWAIGGYSGTGNVLGAVYGRSVAHRAFGRQSALDDVLDATSQ